MKDAAEPTQTVPIAPKAGPAGRAAGILFLADTGKVLLVRRGNGGDFPGHWGLPGGHVEPGETTEEAARREALEETGLDYKGQLEAIHDDGQFVTYLAKGGAEFPVTLCDESTGFDWTDPNQAPQPLHPGLTVAFRIAGAGSELDIARLMADGILPSPQRYANMHLLALRITGTGLAYRSAIGEHVWRDASIFMSEDFLARCNGLPVIMDHPEASVLSSDEFKDRAIGAIMLPYLKPEAGEVWGIARIYDDPSMSTILQGEVSTSPSVVFDETAGGTKMQAPDGQPLLIEGHPFLLDHIAIVTKDRGSRGVWDKDGPPTGVELNNPEITTMADENVTTTAADAANPVLAALNALTAAVQANTAQTASVIARVDAMEKNMPAPPLQTAADKKADGENPFEKKGEEKAEEKADAEGSDEGKEEGKSGEIKPDAKSEDDCKADDEKAAKADEEMAEMADAQAKADSVYAAFGKSASRPLAGETLLNYRKRLLRPLQVHSDAYKSVDLKGLKDAALLAIAEKAIFADALVAAKVTTAHADQLVEHVQTDRAGRRISTFTGSMGAWLNDFKVPSSRVVAFNTPGSRHYQH